MVEDKKSNPFRAFDLEASFAEGSVGQAANRVIDQDGAKKLDQAVWDAGHLAYECLCIQGEGKTGVEAYRAYASRASTFLRDRFFPDLLELIQAGRIKVSNGSSAEFVAAWEKYDWVEQLNTFLQVADHADAQFSDEILEMEGVFRAYIASALLRRIDDAVISVFMDNRGLIEVVVAIVEFRDRLKLPPKHQFALDAAVGAARKQIGKAGAAAKLAKDPKQIAKLAVRECWELWQKDPSRYKGPTDFSSDMLKKFEELKSIDVVMRWNREWNKEVT